MREQEKEFREELLRGIKEAEQQEQFELSKTARKKER